MPKEYIVYILANVSRTTYIGMTSNLEARLYQHRQKVNPGFTQDYIVNLLVYYVRFANVDDAIARERQLKNWSRAKKHALIESMNPTGTNLSAGWD